MPKHTLICKGKKIFGIIAVNSHDLYFSEKALIEVSSQTYTEQYKRIDLKNIQALVAKPTNKMTFSIIAYTLLTLFMISFVVLGGTAIKIIFGIFAIIFIVPLLSTLIAGKTCEVHVITAVGDYPLLSIQNYKSFQRATKIIKQIILPIQGTVSSVDIDNNIEEYSQIESRA